MIQRHRLAIHAGVIATLVVLVAFMMGRSSRPEGVPEPKRHARPPVVPVSPSLAAETFPPAAPRPTAPGVKPWPPKEIVLSREGVPVGEKKPAAKIAAPEPPKEMPAEASAPSAEEIKELAGWKLKDAETPGKARGLLLDPARSSTIKLIALEKLKTVPPENLVPLLVEFLKTDASEGGAYTIPSAVKVLVAMTHPLAEQALADLYAHSPDDRVRLAIASFKGWKR